MLEEVFAAKRCGTITPTICKISDNNKYEVVFIIKDEIGYIKRVNNEPVIAFKNGMINVNNTIAFVNIINLNNDKDLMYESFIDYYNPDGKEIIDSLCTQSRLIFQIRDKYLKNVGQFVVENKLNKLATRYREKCLTSKPWSSKDFQVAKFLVYEKYEDVIDIWNKLSC